MVTVDTQEGFLPASIIGSFNGTFQPHLDQMWHTPIDDASRKRQNQVSVGNTSKVVRQVGINDIRFPSMQPLLYFDYRLLGMQATVSVLLGWKVSFDDS
ncbi:hypothetical protein [Burkholderia gladioli]|uniref:hypothetical protein n=1 Tax=Burkholderia gladioli TaxID=28095 RepID=UPI0016401369|nr:hypothetical protein [Burkholderia gladioli]